MLKETKAEETIVCFVTFLSLVAFQLGGKGGQAPSPPPPQATRILPQCICIFFAFFYSKDICICLVGQVDFNVSETCLRVVHEALLQCNLLVLFSPIQKTFAMCEKTGIFKPGRI